MAARFSATGASRAGVDAVVTLEEHTRIGGLGSAIVDCLCDRAMLAKPVLRLGLPDKFTHNYGSQDGLLKHYGLDSEGIANSISSFVARPSETQRLALVRN